jgi:hypothetical protein
METTSGPGILFKGITAIMPGYQPPAMMDCAGTARAVGRATPLEVAVGPSGQAAAFPTWPRLTGGEEPITQDR